MDSIGTSHQTAVEDTFIAWSEMGSGPPLVLLHGIADSRRTWRRAAPLLARGFRVLMPDLPGHGWSGRPDASYTLGWYARMVAGWMDAIGLARAHICGHSFGGGVAQWMLLENRARVERLALAASGGLGREVTPALRLATFPLFGPLLTPPVMWLGVLLAPRLFPAQLGHMEPAEARLLVRMSRVRGTARAFRRTLASVINLSGQYMQTIQRAHEVTLPAIALFWGAEDPIIPVHHGTGLLDRFTGVTLTTYSGCGHFLQLERPGAFARDLGAFLSDPVRRRALLTS